MRIEVLTFEDCPNATKTRELVHAAVRLEAANAHIAFVNVGSVEAALHLQFLGSPSVRINGEDVETTAAGRTSFGLMCRTYSSGAGASGTPPLEMIRASIRRAAIPSSTREK